MRGTELRILGHCACGAQQGLRGSEGYAPQIVTAPISAQEPDPSAANGLASRGRANAARVSRSTRPVQKFVIWACTGGQRYAAESAFGVPTAVSTEACRPGKRCRSRHQLSAGKRYSYLGGSYWIMYLCSSKRRSEEYGRDQMPKCLSSLRNPSAERITRINPQVRRARQDSNLRPTA